MAQTSRNFMLELDQRGTAVCEIFMESVCSVRRPIGDRRCVWGAWTGVSARTFGRWEQISKYLRGGDTNGSRPLLMQRYAGGCHKNAPFSNQPFLSQGKRAGFHFDGVQKNKSNSCFLRTVFMENYLPICTWHLPQRTSGVLIYNTICKYS